MRTLRRTLIAALLFPALMGTALAQHRGGHRAVDGPARAWRGDIGRFHEHDIDHWRGGRWYQGRHDGRFGWWWIVAGTWYFYPWRVDPYPDPYQPPVVVLPPTDVAPPFWYYCADPAGYYPYVPRCRVPWQRVAASVSPNPPPP